MGRQSEKSPPRPIAPGDVVTAYSSHVGEWIAAQVIELDPKWKKAWVLELDWSGPKPASVADVAGAGPLVLNFASWHNRTACVCYEWTLPRRFAVLGSLPPRADGPAGIYSQGWPDGSHLASQRRWDRGEREPLPEEPASQARPPWASHSGAELVELLDRAPAPLLEVDELRVEPVVSLDCGKLVEVFPNLARLSLWGKFGTLAAAGRLNELTRLRRLVLTDLFGMGGADCPSPQSLPDLEYLSLRSVPAEYAKAARSAWRDEPPKGVHVSVALARKPEWVAENLDNPLRDWDGREHIGAARYRRAVALYKEARRGALALLAEGFGEDQLRGLSKIGEEYGEAFNRLGRSGWIETVEREELHAALEHIVSCARARSDEELGQARERLLAGMEKTRDW